MNILVLTDRYPPHYRGGYELNCHKITEGLRALGHTCTVLTTTFGVDERIVEGHVHRVLNPVYWQPRGLIGRRVYQVKSFFRAAQNYRMTRAMIRQIKPDLVFIWHVEAMSILPILALQDTGIPTVFRLASHWLIHAQKEYLLVESRLRKWYRSALLGFRRFDEVELRAAAIATESLRQSYREAGYQIDETAVIPNGIPAAWIASDSPTPAPGKGLRLLYAGRLEAEKGVDVIVNAVADVVNKRGHTICLELIGTGEPEYVALLEELIARHNLGEVVTFVPFVPQQELVNRYAQYDVLVAASLRWEGFGMTLIEAMAKGVTVITSDIGGPRDIVTDGHDGLLVPPGEPLLLADAIERVIREPGLRAALGAAALHTVREKYVLETVIRQYETYLRGRVLKPHPQPLPTS